MRVLIASHTLGDAGGIQTYERGHSPVVWKR